MSPNLPTLRADNALPPFAFQPPSTPTSGTVHTSRSPLPHMPSGRKGYHLPPLLPTPSPSAQQHPPSSAVPRLMPTSALTFDFGAALGLTSNVDAVHQYKKEEIAGAGADATFRMPPSRQPLVTPFDALPPHPSSSSTKEGRSTILPEGRSTTGDEEESALFTLNHSLGPTQHSAAPLASQLFSFPSSAPPKPYVDTSAARTGHLPQQSARDHWAPEDGAQGGQRPEYGLGDREEGRNGPENQGPGQGQIHAPRPSRAIDVQGLSQTAVGRRGEDSYPLGSPPSSSQTQPQLHIRSGEREEGSRIGARHDEQAQGYGPREERSEPSMGGRRSTSPPSSQRFQRTYTVDHGHDAHSQARSPVASLPQSQSQYQASKHARVDSYQPGLKPHDYQQSRQPAIPSSTSARRSQTSHMTRTLNAPMLPPRHTPVSVQNPTSFRSASTRPFVIPETTSRAVDPSTHGRNGPPAWRPGPSVLGQKVRNPAELFMATASNQGGQGVAKTSTTSEKILARIDECFDQMSAQIAAAIAIQQQSRDQLHDLRLAQKALATREEVVEDIAAQLSPALHESFQSLTTSISRLLEPLAGDTAKFTVEKMRSLMAEMKEEEDEAREQDSENLKPLSSLMAHLTSKLDSVSSIATFIDSCKDLPEALRDVAVYKQSVDAFNAMVQKQALQPTSSMSVQAMYEELKGSLHGIEQKLGSPSHATGAGLAMGELISAVKAMESRLSRSPPLLSGTTSSNPLELGTGVDTPSTDAIERKVDQLSADVAALKDLLVRHCAQPVQLDMPTIIEQLREAIMAPAIEPIADDHAHLPLDDGIDDGEAKGVGHLDMHFDFSRAFQPTHLGSTQVPDPNLITPNTSTRTSMTAIPTVQDRHHDNNTGGGFSFQPYTPYGWQSSEYVALNMGAATGSGGQTPYTDIAQINGDAAMGSAFIDMQQYINPDAFGQYTSTELDKPAGHKQHAQTEQERTQVPQPRDGNPVSRTVAGHRINDFRQGPDHATTDGRSDRSGPDPLTGMSGQGVGSTADVFGTVQNIPPAANALFSAKPAGKQAHQTRSFDLSGPNFSTATRPSPSPTITPHVPITDDIAQLVTGEPDPTAGPSEKEESFEDEYADFFNRPQTKSPVSTSTRNRSGSSGKGGRGKSKKRSGAIARSTPAPSPAAAQAIKKAKPNPVHRSSSVIPTQQQQQHQHQHQHQPVAARTRRGSMIGTPAMKAHPAVPVTPLSGARNVNVDTSPCIARGADGKARKGSGSDEAFDRFGAPRRLSDRIARQASARSNITGNENANVFRNPADKAKNGPATADTNADTPQIQAHADKMTRGRSNGLEVQVEDEEGDESIANTLVPNTQTQAPIQRNGQRQAANETIMSLLSDSGGLQSGIEADSKVTQTQYAQRPNSPQWPQYRFAERERERQPSRGPGMAGGSGRKAVTYGNRKRKMLEMDDEDSSG